MLLFRTTKLCQRITLTLSIIVLIIFCAAKDAKAWKPKTHVFLAKEVLDEIFSTRDFFGNEKVFGSIPIYRVDYQTGETLDVIGYYDADVDLLSAIEFNQETFLTGTLGPDAYPDLPTGQSRIHVDSPVFSNEWLEYLWLESENASPQVKAFVTGYISHAAGDMFMHTFVNYYAGGEFTVKGLNAEKHYILESYIGKRTEELDADIYKIDLPTQVINFIYENLVDARKGTFLQDDLYKASQLSSGEVSQIASIPLLFSLLRDGLQQEIDDFNAQIEAFDREAEELDDEINDLEIQADLCNPLSNNFSPLDCAEDSFELLSTLLQDRIAAKAALFLRRNTYELAHLLPTQYLRAWVEDIDTGLKQWPVFSTEIAKAIVFPIDGMDLVLADSKSTDYKNNYLLSMLGLPDAVGSSIDLINTMKDKYMPDLFGLALENITNMIDFLLRNTFDISIETIEEYFKSPERHFDIFLQLDDPFAPSETPPHALTLEELNNDILHINDNGFQRPNLKFDPDTFTPAYNTMTMIKLILLSEDSLVRLRNDLGCNSNLCRMPGANAMLGFLKSMDAGNTWKRGDDTDTRPGPDEEQMVFAECNAYFQIFKQQIGEEDVCPPKLETPDISPESGTSSAPVTVTINHTDNEAQIYYTISEQDAPVEPTNNPEHSQSHLYTQPFSIGAPFIGSVRPLIVRARAFKDGAIDSDTNFTSYTVDARLQGMTVNPNGGDFTGFVNVTIFKPTGSTVYYTLNGEIPDFNSTLYTGPIRLTTGAHTLKAVALRIGFNQSDILSAVFNVFDQRTDRVADVEFSPRSSGRFTNSLEVEMLSRTENAEIRYTIAKDQVPQDPTEQSQLFTTPFTLQLGNWFVRAKAFKSSMPSSNLNQINYNISEAIGVVNKPVITPNGGIFNNDVEITISATTTPPTTGIQIFFTKDGTTPEVDPQLPGNYKAPFKLNRSSTVKARARRTFFEWSTETAASFKLICADPEIIPGSGVYLDSVEVRMNTVTENAEIRYTTDGSEPNEESLLYSQPFNISDNITLKTKAFKSGYSFSDSTSANFVLQHSSPPLVLQQPISREAIVGDAVSFHVEYNGVPQPDVQWQFKGIDIGGATTDTLNLTSIRLQDAGKYVAILTNASGITASEPAELTVNPKPVLPQITQQPQNLLLNEGTSAVFRIIATGTPPLSYLWYLNGEPIQTQINSTLEFNNVTVFHEGRYSVQVTNDAGTVISDEVTLSIDNTLEVNPTESPTAEETVIPEVTPTIAATIAPTASATLTPDATATPTATLTPEATTTLTPVIADSPTPAPTATPRPTGKSFTFNCESSLRNRFFTGLETLTMNIGDTENCTLKLTKPEAGKKIEVALLLKKGFRSAIRVEPNKGITDDNGELKIIITAIQKGRDWTAWSVSNERGRFKFNKKAYDTGLAWGMFVEVK